MNHRKVPPRRRPLPARAVLLACALAAAAPPLGAQTPARPRFDALVAAAKRRVAELDAAGLEARLRRDPPPVLIDVREKDEWDAGRIPGAVHLSKGVLEREIEALVPDPAAEIVLYCASDARSALAADSLRRMGYTRVRNLQGGYRAWKKERGEEGPRGGSHVPRP